jgi:CBS domain-containing protein
MNRRDAHLDAMLRHLGAAYYDSPHGRAAQADVTRALASVAGRGHQGSQSRVRDVMTTSVVTVDRITPYKQIARLLAEHQVSGLPVLSFGRRVAGVVSEADLLAARDQNPATHQRWARRLTGRTAHQRRIAEDLMTSPAVTISPDATVAAAARLMTARHLRRLPVTDAEGKLLGLVSRRDLLSVFLRPDAEIARQVGEILADLLPGGPTGMQVGVRDGVVTLTGEPELATEEDLVRMAVRLAWDVDGVVDVVNKSGPAPVASASR